MIDFLKRLVNVHLFTVLCAFALATYMRQTNGITAELWGGVVNNALTLFIGGGVVRDGLLALASAIQKKEA